MRSFNELSIRKSLTLLVIISILPALTILLYTGLEQRQSLIADVEKEVQARVHTMAEVQGEMTRDAQRMLSILAALPEVKQLDTQASNRVFDSFITNNTAFTNVALVDLNGDVIASGLPFQQINLADRKHFQAALKDKDFVVGEYIVTRMGTATSALPFAYPVLDAAGESVAVLVTSLKLDFFAKIFDFDVFPEKTFVSVVDHQGIRAFYYPPLPETNPIGGKISSAVWAQSQGAAEQGYFHGCGSDGINRIFAYEKVYLTEKDEPYMYFWAAVPEQYILGPANRTLYRNLLLVVLASIGALIIARFISVKCMLTPINKLMGMTHEFADGTLDLSDKGPDADNELGQLTQSFVSMVRKLAEAERQLKRFNHVVKQANSEIYVIDRESLRFIEVNSGACRNLGYTEEELKGMRLHDIKPLISAEAFTAMVAPLVAGTEDRVVFRTEHQRKDGDRYPVEVTLQFIQEEPPVYLAIVQDISQHIAAEQARLKLEEQLRLKHKMEAIGFMAAGIAHNFNNNLAIILGNIELAELKLGPGTGVASLLGNATSAILRSRDLVKKILTYSQGGAYNKTDIELATVIDDILGLVRSTLPSSVSLRHEYSPECLHSVINADVGQIQEVLLNLVNNAVRAMAEEGEIAVTLEAVTLEQKNIPAQYDCVPGDYLKLGFQDDGCGMSAEMIDKIFDPFYSTKEASEGAGMGLSTIQGILSQHQGAIKVNSVINRGTTIDLYFPIVERSPILDLSAEPIEMPKGNERILFIDDEAQLVGLGHELLSSLGYEVESTTDSAEALKLFSDDFNRFDLVITDQTMPNLTGRELIKELKVIRPDIPTILCTGHSSKIEEESATALGIDAFAYKPLDLNTLSQLIRRVLNGRG
jgi:PAS domain S-box-containing protein